MNAPLSTLPEGRRWAILGALMTGLFLSAMDQTVVGTALPRIIAELSGVSLYAWVFTSYMLASTTAVPIVGKMGDIYGRKQFLIAGIIIFLIASALCGLSQNMIQLIAFRGVQGLGGGFLVANAFAMIGDLYTPAERGRYAGIMSSAFGLASVIGPLVGGAITDHISWRWVFYVNLPIGIVALIVLSAVLPASGRRQERVPVDYAGAAALVVCIVPMLLAFSWAGVDYAWASPQVIGPFAVSAVALAAFLVIETRAEDPMIPLSLFRNRIFAVATAVTFVSGVAMFAGMVYIPLFMQGVLDFSATNAGLVLTPMTLSMVAASAICGQLVSRTGRYKWFAVVGLGLATVGLIMLTRLGVHSSQMSGMEAMSVLGFGLGLSFPVLVLATQNAVPYRLMGITTSLNQFARSVGGTIGVAIMGSILTRRLDSELRSGLPADVRARAPAPLLNALSDPRILLDGGALAKIRDEAFGAVFGADAPRLFEATVESMKEGLASSISVVFVMAAATMALSLAMSIFLPEAPLRQTHELPAVEAVTLADAADDDSPQRRAGGARGG